MTMSLNCIVYTGDFCGLDTALHPVDRVQDCSYFLFEKDKEKIKDYCQVSEIKSEYRSRY